MTPRFLVELKDEICHPVTIIMKASLETGVVSDGWKTANVTPIFKKGSKSQITNYRPASLRRHFFCERVIDRWISLSQPAINSTSVFQNCLNKLSCNEMGFFMD